MPERGSQRGGGGGGGRQQGRRNAGEADPFARLTQTHRRLEERLDDLVRAAEQIASGDYGVDPIEAIDEVLDYLARGGRRHVIDEEETLFPRLRDLRELSPILAQLEREHREHEGAESELRAAWNPLKIVTDRDRATQLANLTKRLRSIYAAHIRAEEEALFPNAQRLLTPETVADMGREMMDRRPDRGKS